MDLKVRLWLLSRLDTPGQTEGDSNLFVGFLRNGVGVVEGGPRSSGVRSGRNRSLGLLAITVFSAAYTAEIIRGGLQAIPSGQFEAARALGLPGRYVMLLIVLPQAIRNVIPAIAGSDEQRELRGKVGTISMERPGPAEPMIICVDVHKWFGDFHVLKGVTTTVGKGEVVVVMGTSGSGQSTFIRTINRLEQHQQGQIIVDGIELTNDTRNIEAIRREVGMVFQSFNLFPHLTAM